MSCSEKAIFTNLCMVCDGKGNILVQDRKDPSWPGICFPGGHVELGESFTEAVIREIQEETGLTIFSPQLCGIKDWYENECRYVVLFYKATQFEGNLQSSSEGEVWWEDIENLSTLNLSLDMNDMVRVFREDDLSEFFYYQKDNRWVYDLK